MRVMKYEQAKEELEAALETIGQDYEITPDKYSITVVPGHFAYYKYNIRLPEIVLPCGIKISNVNAVYPYYLYMGLNSDISDDTKFGYRSGGEEWSVSYDLGVYPDEDLGDPDAVPYNRKELVRLLLVEVIADFLRYPGHDNGIQLPYGKKPLMPFDMVAKQWLEEIDLNRVSKHEHEMITRFGGDDVVCEYIMGLRRLDRLPDSVSLVEFRRVCELYFGWVDLSQFTNE